MASATARRRLLFPSLIPLLILALVVLACKPVNAAASTGTADDDATDGGQETGRYPLMARLAPCLPLPVNSNCSQVPDTLQRNLLTCTHVSFQPGGFGQGAHSAQLAFEVEADDDGGASGQGGESGGGLTMVLLVGSTLWFEDQAAMYEALQPRLQAALQASHGYDPTLQGPCMGGGMREQQQDDGLVAVGRRRRRQRRRLLRGLEEQQQEQQGAAAEGDGGLVSGEGLPSCADVVAAFNAVDRGLAEAAAPFAFLYTCNVTSAPRPPQPNDEGRDSNNPNSNPQLLAYDALRPDDYPFTYFVFINANVAPADDAADDPTEQETLAAATSRAVNQTVRYAATFSPTFSPASAQLPQPAFALLLLLCVVALLGMSAYVSAPVLDKLAQTRCGKWCLQGRA